MAEAVSLELVHNDLTVPPPDNLIAGNWGTVYADLVKISAKGEYKRGTLLMSGSNGYVASTREGLSTADSFCILADDVTVGDDEYAETAAYFQGEFNDARVIFPFETGEDDHQELVELAIEPLRKGKIFLRHMHL